MQKVNIPYVILFRHTVTLQKESNRETERKRRMKDTKEQREP